MVSQMVADSPSTSNGSDCISSSSTNASHIFLSFIQSIRLLDQTIPQNQYSLQDHH